ncbi:histone H1.1, embryonic-like [Asterias rubens]|uniref:histone H1.1, embryonic-like n=1 Tax=Asterias rubens TaxID=7604 RepID=UPI0014551DD8|nr:histone H1.1, embryonic-like [Asterias rubens]
MATVKKSATVRAHPPAIKMVVAAIVALKEKNGSSSQAIRKYIKDTFQVDMDRQAVFIRKALNTGVQKGVLIQTKGKGASGSFKLDPAKDKAKEQAEKVKERAKAKKEKDQAKKAEMKAKKAEKAAAKKEKAKKTKITKKKTPKKIVKKTPTKKVAAKKTAAKPSKKVAKPSKAAKSPKPKLLTKRFPRIISLYHHGYREKAIKESRQAQQSRKESKAKGKKGHQSSKAEEDHQAKEMYQLAYFCPKHQ